MEPVRRLVVDVLKPHDPPLLEFTQQVADLGSVEGVTSSLLELDKEVQNVELAIEGAALEYDAVEERIDGLGGTIHSVDQVSCGAEIVDDRPGAHERNRQ